MAGGATTDGPRVTGAAAGNRAAVFLLSLRYHAEVVATLEAAGRAVSAARRTADAPAKFERADARIAVVDIRGAFAAGLEAVRALAAVAEKRRAALLVILSRFEMAGLDEVYAAGATHVHVPTRRRDDLDVAINFADRYVRRLRAGGAADAVASAQARLSAGARWSWRKGDPHIVVTPAFADMLGEPIGRERVPVAVALAHFDPADRDDFVRGLARLARSGISGDLEYRMMMDGRIHSFAHHIRTTRGPDGRLTGLSATVEDLDALLLERRLSAHFDLLTGLANASFARDWLEQLLGGRSDFDPACIVLLLSVSRFDGINAAYGRVVADALLQAVARRIRRVAGADRPEAMLVARVGGAEFAVAFAGPVKLADVVMLAERLGEAFAQPFLVAGKLIHLASRAGIAVGEKDLDGADTLLRRASAALAQAKSGEPNSVEIFMGKGPEDLVTRMARLGDDLRAALELDSLELLYQPQVEIASGRIIGVEALTRWRHAKLGLLPAETLMGVADAAEMTQLVGRHLLAKALAEAVQWPERLRKLRLAVNLTAEDMALPDFAEQVMGALKDSGFAPERLTVEVTETNMMRDVEHATRVLSALRHHGVSIAIDDFGTGYSSLAYLRTLPLDYLKIDKRLVEDLLGAPRNRVVVSGVVNMARTLGLRVIAEGVETLEQRAAVTRAGCHIYQGFLCSRPIGIAALDALCADWQPRLEPVEEHSK